MIEEFKNSKIGDDLNSKLLLDYILMNIVSQKKQIVLGLYVEKIINLKTGQFWSSSVKIGKKLGLSRQEVRTALYKLAFFGFINYEGSHYGTVITVKNYDNEVDESHKPLKRRKPTMREQKKIDIQEARKAQTLIEPYPVDPAEVVKAAERIGYKMTQETAELFIANYAATGWIAGNGQPIRKWTAMLYRWKNNAQSKTFTSSKKPDRNNPDYSNPENYTGSFRKK